MTEEEVEMQLNRLFHAAVGDPPEYVSLGAIRRLVVMRRIVMSVTATAAMVLTGCVGLAVAAATGRAPASGTGPAAGQPRYYYEEGTVSTRTSPGFKQQNVIRATATGAITGTVRCPWRHSFIGQAAVAAPETIYLVCFRGFRNAQQYFVTTGTRIYRFTLTSGGRPADYTLLPGGVFPAESVGSLAVAAGGSDYAVVVGPGRAGATSSQIVVVNARTGARAVWSGHMLPGGVHFRGPQLSLTANGRVLGVFGVGTCRKHDPACKSPGEEMLALSPAAKGGQIASGRKIFTEPQVVNTLSGYINAAFLTPDGTAATVAVVDTAFVAAVQVSARTGKTMRVLYKQRTGNGFSYRLMSPDPTGKFVLFDAGPPRGAVNGWIDRGKLIPLKPQDDSAGEEVW